MNYAHCHEKANSQWLFSGLVHANTRIDPTHLTVLPAIINSKKLVSPVVIDSESILLIV